MRYIQFFSISLKNEGPSVAMCIGEHQTKGIDLCLTLNTADAVDTRNT